MYFNPLNVGKDSPHTNSNDLQLSNPVEPTRKEDPVFRISEFQNCKDANPKHRSHTWETFCEEFTQHKIGVVKDGPAWSPVRYADHSRRGNDNVISVCMAVIDVDDGTPHESVLGRFQGYTCLIHSSFSHSAMLEKYRIILPLSTSVPAQDWKEVWERINQQAGGCNDAATKDPARLYYKPVHPVGTNDHFVKIQQGVLLSVDSLPALISPVREHPMIFQRNLNVQPFAEIDGIECSGPELGFEQGLTEVVSRCAFMQFASAQENQRHLVEPLWMGMISNGCRFENCEPWIHSASEHHPEYDEAETEAKIRRLQNGPAPITCQRIRELGFAGCPSGGCKTPKNEVTKAPAGLYGWMFNRQLTRSEASAALLPEKYSVGDSFIVSADGVFQQKIAKDGTMSKMRISSRIDVVALTRDHDSTNWGLELQFTDPDGITKNWALPMELLASAGDAYRAALLKMGATVEPGGLQRDGLTSYLIAAKPDARSLAVKQPGWFGNLFVLPDAVYGRSEERVTFQTSDPDEIKRFSIKGTLESWQQYVASPCQGNSRAVISICIGLAPPLLALLGEDNGGFHFRGNSSIGKSVCLSLGSSVWGGAALVRTWNMTVNGLEGVATMHNDVLLPLDELGQADAKAAGEAAYMLGNGQGKSRSNREGDARAAKRFRNIVLSSGEKSMGDLMAQTGQVVMAGQEVRMVEIAADTGCGYGVFEDIHGAKSSQVFAEAIKREITQHHGHAGRAFVEILANPDLQPRLVEKISALIQRFVDTYVPAGATGQVGRVGRRFGLVAAAGEICIELGILPWPEDEAFDACRKCFMSWIDLRGGIGNHEAAQAVEKVRRFIELHGESRFTPWTAGIDNNGLGKTIQRAGFRRVTDDDRTEYFIFPEVYKSEICVGLNPTYVTKVLKDREFLVIGKDGKAQVEKYLPGMGKMRVYHMKADIMNDEIISHLHKEETDGRQTRVSASAMKFIV